MQTRPGRRQEKTIRVIRQTFIGPKHTQQFVYLVVIRFYIIITDRPVISKAIDAFPFEVFRAEAQRDPTPVIRTSAQHTGAPPLPGSSAGIAGLCIRFAIYFPTPVTAIKVAEWTKLCWGATTWRLPGVLELIGICLWIEHRTCFQQANFESGIRQYISGHASACT